MNDAAVTRTRALAAPPTHAPDPGATAAPASSLPIGTRLQEFEIAGVVGHGGFGIVYLARDRALERTVAIKEYMPAQLAHRVRGGAVQPSSPVHAETYARGLRGFLDEARMLARLHHRALVQVLRFWEQNGTAYMVMPYVEGVSLAQHVASRAEPMDEAAIRRIAEPLMDALEHMHAADCLHRDVAPDNILVRADGTPVLLDLGAARRVIGDMARALTVMLKPGYAPIEQYADDPALAQGPWTDVYGLAGTLYFAITARAPAAAAARVLHDAMPSLAALAPPGVPAAMVAAIDRALAVRPQDRPQSMAEFRAALQGVALPATRADRGAPAASRATGARRRVSPTYATLAFVGAAVAIASVIAWRTLGTASPGHGLAGAVATDAVPAEQAPALARPDAAPAPGAAAPAEADAGGASDAAPSAPAHASTSGAERARTPGTPGTPGTAGTADTPGRAGTAGTAGTDGTAAGAPGKVAGKATDAPGRIAPAHGGVLTVDVRPWAEVYVTGAYKGVSPPLKRLALAPGRYSVELRNPAAAPTIRVIEVKPQTHVRVEHRFE